MTANADQNDHDQNANESSASRVPKPIALNTAGGSGMIQDSRSALASAANSSVQTMQTVMTPMSLRKGDIVDLQHLGSGQITLTTPKQQ